MSTIHGSPQPTVLSLCSGLAGLDVGVNRTFGSRTVGYVERDSFAQAVLLARMEEEALDPAPVFADLEEFDCSPWVGCVDAITAGYP